MEKEEREKMSKHESQEITIYAFKNNWYRDFPGGPVGKTPHYQCRGPCLDPWSGNQVLHAATKSSHAATKKPACRNKDPAHCN